MNRKAVRMDENSKVTKSNKLVEAHYKLTPLEQKFILFMASLVQPTEEDFKFYDVQIKDALGVLGMSRGKYSDVHKIVENLLKKTLRIKEPEGFVTMNWVASVKVYNRGIKEGIVSFEFSERLKPYLLQLKREFTSYYLKNVVQLKSVYSIRLYELLKQYEGVGKREISLSELRAVLGIPDKYKLYGHFKDKVLNVALREIPQKTDISFRYKEIKTGRKVTAFIFYISPKKAVESEPKKEPKPTPELFPPVKDLPQIVKELLHAGIKKKTALTIHEQGFDFVNAEERKTVDDMSFEQYVREKIYLVNNQPGGKLKNKSGFLLDAIQENYTDTELLERQKQEAKRKKEASTQRLESQRDSLQNERDDEKKTICRHIVAERKDEMTAIIETLRTEKKDDYTYKHYYDPDRTPLENYFEPKHIFIQMTINAKLEELYPDDFQHLTDVDTKIAELETKISLLKQ